MFEDVKSRFALRISLVAAAAGLATLKTKVGDGLSAEEVVDVVASGVTAGLAYLGIGSVSKSVEPNVGRKK